MSAAALCFFRWMVAAVSRGRGPAAARGAVPDVRFVQAAPTTEGDGIWSFAASVGALGVAAAMLKLEKLALPRELPSAELREPLVERDRTRAPQRPRR